MVRFFTNVCSVDLPLKYVVTNPLNDSCLATYMRRYGDVVEEIIIDTGVDYWFKKLNLRDYPTWYIRHYINYVSYIAKRYSNKKVLAVVPDIPVDYPNREHLYPWNVERTLEYIRMFITIDFLANVILVCPVQGRKDDIHSVLKTYTENIDLYRECDMLALSPTCTTRKWRVLGEMIVRFDIAVQHHTRQYYHVFGAHVNAIKYAIQHGVKYLYSFDSTAYYYYNSKKVSGKNQRTEALKNYLNKIPFIKY